MSDMLTLAAAINKLADAIISTGAAMGSVPEETPSSPRSEVAAAEPPKASRKKAEPKQDPAPEPEAEVEDLLPAIKKLGLEVAKDNRDGVVDLLKEYNVPDEKLGNVPPAQQAEFLGRLEKLKAEDDLA